MNTIVPFYEETVMNNQLHFPHTCLLLSIMKQHEAQKETDKESWKKLEEFFVEAFDKEALISGLADYYNFIREGDGDPTILKHWKHGESY